MKKGALIALVAALVMLLAMDASAAEKKGSKKDTKKGTAPVVTLPPAEEDAPPPPPGGVTYSKSGNHDLNTRTSVQAKPSVVLVRGVIAEVNGGSITMDGETFDISRARIVDEKTRPVPMGLLHMGITADVYLSYGRAETVMLINFVRPRQAVSGDRELPDGSTRQQANEPKKLNQQ